MIIGTLKNYLFCILFNAWKTYLLIYVTIILVCRRVQVDLASENASVIIINYFFCKANVDTKKILYYNYYNSFKRQVHYR